MDRRGFLGIGGAALAGGVAASTVPAVAGIGTRPDVSRIEAALAAFETLPGPTSYMLRVDDAQWPWQVSLRANADLFVGSAIKAFINVKFLQDVERGKLSLDAPFAIDDNVRSLSSSVFIDLTGTTPGRSVLEAMITHSDNTATDVALAAVGVERVRKFIAKAGLESAKIPGSTRLLFSYLAGARFGVDKGWKGMLKIADDKLFGKPRSPMNNRETMRCTATDFVTFYERALAGRYFREAATLAEFKRIHAMPGMISLIAPPDTPTWVKGGSIEWEDFNALCVPGQMRLGGTVPVTFCFTVNWDGPPSTIPGVQSDFIGVLKKTFREVQSAFG